MTNIQQNFGSNRNILQVTKELLSSDDTENNNFSSQTFPSLKIDTLDSKNNLNRNINYQNDIYADLNINSKGLFTFSSNLKNEFTNSNNNYNNYNTYNTYNNQNDIEYYKNLVNEMNNEIGNINKKLANIDTSLTTSKISNFDKDNFYSLNLSDSNVNKEQNNQINQINQNNQQNPNNTANFNTNYNSNFSNDTNYIEKDNKLIKLEENRRELLNKNKEIEEQLNQLKNLSILNPNPNPNNKYNNNIDIGINKTYENYTPNNNIIKLDNKNTTDINTNTNPNTNTNSQSKIPKSKLEINTFMKNKNIDINTNKESDYMSIFNYNSNIPLVNISPNSNQNQNPSTNPHANPYNFSNFSDINPNSNISNFNSDTTKKSTTELPEVLSCRTFPNIIQNLNSENMNINSNIVTSPCPEYVKNDNKDSTNVSKIENDINDLNNENKILPKHHNTFSDITLTNKDSNSKISLATTNNYSQYNILSKNKYNCDAVKNVKSKSSKKNEKRQSKKKRNKSVKSKNCLFKNQVLVNKINKGENGNKVYNRSFSYSNNNYQYYINQIKDILNNNICCNSDKERVIYIVNNLKFLESSLDIYIKNRNNKVNSLIEKQNKEIERLKKSNSSLENKIMKIKDIVNK